jgi:hypothetical protein
MKRVGGITAIGILLLVAAWLAVFLLGRRNGRQAYLWRHNSLRAVPTFPS